MIVTFDANVLVYSTGPLSDLKSVRAQEVIERGLRADVVVFLLQTIAEFSDVSIRKSASPASEVRRIANGWRLLRPVHAFAEPDLDDALEAVGRHRLQFWDAVLWATARRVGVRLLLTEDFQDGRELGGVTFVNPFKPANDALIDRVLPG